jgi:hypothetical protein
LKVEIAHIFLDATKRLYNSLHWLVGWLVRWLVGWLVSPHIASPRFVIQLVFFSSSFQISSTSFDFT